MEEAFIRNVEPNLIEELKTETNTLVEKAKVELGAQVLELLSEDINKVRIFIRQMENAKSVL